MAGGPDETNLPPEKSASLRMELAQTVLPIPVGPASRRFP